MKITLTKSVLVGPADVQVTPRGTEVDLDDQTAKEFIAEGLATAPSVKAAPDPKNKQAPDPANKARK